MKHIQVSQAVETAEHEDIYLLTPQLKAMDRIEFEDLLKAAEREFALGYVMAKQDADRWYSDVITVSFGTTKAKMDARKQLEERREEMLKLEADRLRERIEAKYFGDYGGRREALRAIEAAEAQAKLEIAPSEKRTPRGVLMRLRVRLNALL